MSTEQHAKNFTIVLGAMKEQKDVIDVEALGVSNVSAQSLAEGDLQALNDVAGIFGSLCNALLQHGEAGRPPTGSSSSMPPARAAARPASAIPASKSARPEVGLATGAAPGGEETEEEAADAATGGAGVGSCGACGSGAAAAAHAACAAACTDALVAAAAPKSKAKTKAGLTPRGRKPTVKLQSKNPSALMHLNAISNAAAQRGRPRSAPAKGATPRPASGAAGTGGASTHLEAEIAELQAKILGRKSEGEAAARLSRAISDEFGSKASGMYAALIKQSLAGVRRAEALEIARGVASSRNAQRDQRIAAIREQRIGSETERAEAARAARRSAKEELKYRSLYQQALSLERERLLLEESTIEEARRKALESHRKRSAAMESFHVQQLDALHSQLDAERQERVFREKVQLSMGAKLEAEARANQAAALRALKEQLDHNEALEESVRPVPIF